MLIVSLAAAIALAGVHVVAARLRFLDGVPRSQWLSGAGGVSVAYVFVHLMPELAEGQAAAAALESGAFAWLEREVYLVALAGLLAFYGVERLVKTSAELGHDADRETSSAAAFWVHLGSFALYNVIVGYLLLHRDTSTLTSLAVFAVAMALHFLVTDYGLRLDYEHSWTRIGRWVLVGAVLVGWGLAAVTELPDLGVSGLTAFLGGGVVLNVLKEELPEERKSRFSALLLGAVGYAALLLLV